jgi:hypothetical protein
LNITKRRHAKSIQILRLVVKLVHCDVKRFLSLT